MEKNKFYYSLTVSYDLEIYEWGSLDSKIEKKVGSDKYAGSGTGFGLRELFFEFPTKRGADGGLKRLKEMKLKKCKAKVSKEERLF